MQQFDCRRQGGIFRRTDSDANMVEAAYIKEKCQVILLHGGRNTKVRDYINVVAKNSDWTIQKDKKGETVLHPFKPQVHHGLGRISLASKGLLGNDQ